MKQHIENALSSESCDLSSTLLTQEELLDVLEHLSHSTTVTSLSFDFNHANENVFSALYIVLQKNVHLKALSLSHTNLNESTISYLAQALKENVGLEQLDLSFNSIEDGGVYELCCALACKPTPLTCLHLKNCSFTEEGAGFLGEFLSGDSALKELDITGNIIGDRGLMALLKGLHSRRAKAPSQLESLNLWGVGITTTGVQNIAEVLRNYPNNIRELTLSGNSHISAEAGNVLLDLIENNTQLCHLEALGSSIPRSLQCTINSIACEHSDEMERQRQSVEDDEDEDDFQEAMDAEYEQEGPYASSISSDAQEEEASSLCHGDNENGDDEDFSLISYPSEEECKPRESNMYQHEIVEVKKLKEQLERERAELQRERQEFASLKQVWTESLKRKTEWNEHHERVYNEKVKEVEEMKEKLARALASAEVVGEQKSANNDAVSSRIIEKEVTVFDSHGEPISIHLRVRL